MGEGYNLRMRSKGEPSEETGEPKEIGILRKGN